MAKLKIGWFSFSCCEDSTIIFTELLNDHYKEWKNVIEFKSALVLQRKEDLSEMDVAFVEGAITSKEQEEKLRKIRNLSKKLVAIGSCACSGMPSGQRNDFSPEKKVEIEAIITRFSYAAKVQKIADIVPVDAQVSGCPMGEAAFLEVLNKYLVEFGVK
jgi:sulfhydrogenase subunit delta